MVADFPKSGRWYGTFLHHSIAKPYVRDEKVKDKWNESILNLPGVKFILKTIDDLRKEGWSLDAEKSLNCGNIDILATHPEKGTIVFDWKSDLLFDNHDAYIEQIDEYMSELNGNGKQNITGYILWIRDGEGEYVPFKGISKTAISFKKHLHQPLQPIKCTLNIEMNGGDGIRKKKLISYGRPGRYGDTVTFYIPPCEPTKSGYKFVYFEASHYKDEGWVQAFNESDTENGFNVSFLCSPKRHSFTLQLIGKELVQSNAHWRFVNTYISAHTFSTFQVPPRQMKMVMNLQNSVYMISMNV